MPANIGYRSQSRNRGFGVAVLLKIYAHCIDGQAAANDRTAQALAIQDTGPDIGDEGDGDIEQAS